MTLTENIQRCIVEAAILAPSGDNLQPWKFHWEQQRLSIINDAGKDTSLYNVHDLASFVALGAALENIVVAASSHGYRAEPTLFPEAGTKDLAAHVTFTPGELPDPLCSALVRRCSNRRPYAKEPLPAETPGAIAAEVKRFSNVRLHWILQTPQLKQLAKIAAQGDRMLFENHAIHFHFFSCIRWTQNEVERTRDGLPITTLELGGPGAAAFRYLTNWRLVRLLNRLGFSRIAANHSADLIQQSAAIGLITVPDTSPESFMLAGRAFERAWLKATFEELSFQPMTGFVLLQLRVLLREHEGLTQEQVQRINENRQSLLELFHLNGEIPAVMFRVGKSSPPSARTIRRNLSEVMAC